MPGMRFDSAITRHSRRICTGKKKMSSNLDLRNVSCLQNTQVETPSRQVGICNKLMEMAPEVQTES